jgi:hypothetical protein
MTVVPALAAPAVARADDTLAQARGPLAAGSGPVDAIESAMDADWSFFNVSGRTGVTLTPRLESPCDGRVALTLRDANGAAQARAETRSTTGGQAVSEALDGPRRYYVQVTGGAGCRYRIELRTSTGTARNPLPGSVVETIASDSTPFATFSAGLTLENWVQRDRLADLVAPACPTLTRCAILDDEARLHVSHSPADDRLTGFDTASPAWRMTAPAASRVGFQQLECPTVRLCVLAGSTRNGNRVVMTSTDVFSATQPTWRRVDIRARHGSAYGEIALACIGERACLVTFTGRSTRTGAEYYVARSDNPTSARPRWKATRTENFKALDCPSANLCVALGEYRSVGILKKASNPRAKWRTYRLPKGSGPLPTALSCPSARLCVGAAAGFTKPKSSFRLLTSTNPAGGPRSWKVRPFGAGVSGIDCPDTRTCVAVGWTRRASAWVSTAPASGRAAWVEQPLRAHSLSSRDRVACPSPSFCVASVRSQALALSRRP